MRAKSKHGGGANATLDDGPLFHLRLRVMQSANH